MTLDKKKKKKETKLKTSRNKEIIKIRMKKF